MPTAFDIRLDGDGAWPDLAQKQRAGKFVHLGDGHTIGLAALSAGMTTGRASVAFRFDLPDGTAVLVETSLRNLWNATSALVVKYGEPHMQAPFGDRNHKHELAMASLVRQLAEAKQRLGEPLELDMREADAVWDREQKLKQALAAAKSAILCGEAMSPQLEALINNALTGRPAA